MACRVKRKEQRAKRKEQRAKRETESLTILQIHDIARNTCFIFTIQFSDCCFIDITMVSCACTVGIFMGVSRRFVSVLRANMKAKPRQLEHRTSDEIRMLFVPSGVRTVHAGKGKNSFLFALCSFLFALCSLLFTLHAICTLSA